jgi:hypothetical protein
MSASYINKLLLTKPIESYPNSVNQQLMLVSFYKKNFPHLFGSYLYRMQKYASDLDILQKFAYNDEKVVVSQFIRSLKRIIRDLGHYRYFSEFKAGFDPYFKNDDGTEITVDNIIGNLDNGKFIVNPNLKNITMQMYQDGVLNENEKDFILVTLALLQNFNIIQQQNAYDAIYDLIRNKKLLRWSEKEILQSYKLLRGKKYTLAQAIRDNTMVKIDLICLVNGKFVEVTNMVSLCIGDVNENGDVTCVKPINIDDHFLHNVEGLKKEVEKLYYSDKFFSPLKVCKRMYAMSRQLKDYSYVNQLGKILRGDISLMYQIKSELDNFIILLEKVKRPPLKEIDRELSEIKGRINTVLDISNDQIVIISKLIDKVTKINSVEKKLELIKNIYQEAKFITGALAINKMGLLGINPPPSLFLPNVHKYNRSINRKPFDNPNMVFKMFENKIKNDIIKFRKGLLIMKSNGVVENVKKVPLPIIPIHYDQSRDLTKIGKKKKIIKDEFPLYVKKVPLPIIPIHYDQSRDLTKIGKKKKIIKDEFPLYVKERFIDTEYERLLKKMAIDEYNKRQKQLVLFDQQKQNNKHQDEFFFWYKKAMNIIDNIDLLPLDQKIKKYNELRNIMHDKLAHLKNFIATDQYDSDKKIANLFQPINKKLTELIDIDIKEGEEDEEFEPEKIESIPQEKDVSKLIQKLKTGRPSTYLTYPDNLTKEEFIQEYEKRNGPTKRSDLNQYWSSYKKNKENRRIR